MLHMDARNLQNSAPNKRFLQGTFVRAAVVKIMSQAERCTVGSLSFFYLTG